MIIQQRDTSWWYKLNGASRLAIAKGAFNIVGRQLIVTEYPKSGGSWLSQMLSSSLDIPYPRNRLPVFGRQLTHGCYLETGSNVDTIVVWRDGRDIMVSFYYHLVFEKPITSGKFSKELKELLGVSDPYDAEKNMAKFIEWAFNGGYPGFSWTDFIARWIERNDIHQTSYEKVKENPLLELSNALSAIGYNDKSSEELQQIVDHFSFENQTSRKPGEEDVTQFIRKGIVGDWKNVFNKEARQIFDHYAGKELIQLGYEDDHSWV